MRRFLVLAAVAAVLLHSADAQLVFAPPCGLGVNCKTCDTTGSTPQCLDCHPGYEMIGGACSICPVGKSSPGGLAAAAVCTACAAGTYTNTEGTETCTDCEEGTYQPLTGQTSCAKCPAGTYNTLTAKTNIADCVLCGAGTYSSTVGKTDATCDSCPAGTYSTADGATSAATCTNCPAGTYQTLPGQDALADCTDCPAGTYSTLAGATLLANCLDCPIGTYNTGTGKTACTNCAAGKYGIAVAQTTDTCASCPVGTYAPVTGSDAVNDCAMCITGTGAGPASRTCSTTCAASANCATCGGTATACVTCPPGFIFTKTSTASLPGDIGTCTKCAAGTYSAGGTQPACSVCAPGTYSVAGSASCETCDASCKTCSGAGPNACSSCDNDAGRFFNTTAKTCGCATGCSTCTGSATFCTACKPNYKFNDATKTCEPCAPLTYNLGGQATTCLADAGSTDTCAATACNNAASWFSLPALSPNHPSKTGQCTPCDGSKCTQRAGSCNECCFQRQCTDFDGFGTDFCPWGYVSAPATTISSSVLAADNSNLYSVFKDTCCKNTPANSFPAGEGLFDGAVQALSTQDTNWGFVEDTSNYPTVSNNGRYTGMCFKIISTYDCDPLQQPECCQPNTKPAFLQFKLPVSQGMLEQGTDPRYNALTKLARCRLSYARTTRTTMRRMSWKFTNQNKGTTNDLAGAEADDARYATIPLNFGANREATICLYTADIQKDLDCSWETLCGLKPGTPNSIGTYNPNAPQEKSADALNPALGCEVRLVGHARRRVGPTETSKCVGPTYTIFDYSSTSDLNASPSSEGDASVSGFKIIPLNSTVA